MTILASIDIMLVLSVLGTGASLMGVILSALSSTLAKRAENQESPKLIIVSPSSADPGLPETRSLEIDTRLGDTREELARQQSSAKWNRRSATSLAVSQYVVGGTLATSFVQSTLPEGTVGFLGLVVLLSSIIYQRFRPDLRTSAAQRRVAHLKATIRRAEDGLYLLKENLPDAPTIQEIRANVTETLVQIEHSELEDNFLPLPSTPDKKDDDNSLPKNITDSD